MQKLKQYGFLHAFVLENGFKKETKNHTFSWKLVQWAPKDRFILLFDRFGKGSKKGQFFGPLQNRAWSTPVRKLVSPQLKNGNTTFVAYKAPKIKPARPAPNYQRNSRNKQSTRKKILTRLWAFGPAIFLFFCLVLGAVILGRFITNGTSPIVFEKWVLRMISEVSD